MKRLHDSVPRGASYVMRVSADETTARRLASILAETFDPAAAASAFEGPEGWAVEAHFALTPDREAVVDLVRAAAGEVLAREAKFEILEPKDWIAASLEGLRPVPVGRFVVHGAHDRVRVAPNKVGIEIEAALAFGTAHHGTTQGSLAAIERIAKTRRPRHILDIGTGTGVLAIAAARAFHRRVMAGEIDPASVVVARANAEANRAGAHVRVIGANGVNAPAFRGRRYDLVLANILLPVLQRLARPVRFSTARRGTVILSGLLPEQANAALAVWRTQGFTLLRRDIVDGWATLTLARPSKKKSPARARVRR
ncbi:MAG TPA: 50S ribosomal protein L11 methyltransferase [Xanthobacteraceae bacterium]|nr:50S ribosomal protein L11 methyltransferase [Xanthobacteraceae bacterium]